MLKHYYAREAEKMKFMAALQGVDLDKESTNKKSSANHTTENGKITLKSGEAIPFGNPEDYKKMSKRERDNLTRAMMSSHKNMKV